MARIPKVQTSDREINQLQSNIINAVQPFLNKPMVNGILVQNVSLVTGQNIINHYLGRNLQGWIITRQRALAQVYDQQDASLTQSVTLTLQVPTVGFTKTAPLVVDLYCF